MVLKLFSGLKRLEQALDFRGIPTRRYLRLRSFLGIVPSSDSALTFDILMNFTRILGVTQTLLAVNAEASRSAGVSQIFPPFGRGETRHGLDDWPVPSV